MRIILGKNADYKIETTLTQNPGGPIKYSGPVAIYPKNPYSLWSFLSSFGFAKGVISDYPASTYTSRIVKQKSNSFVWKYKSSARSFRVKVLGSNFVYDNELKMLGESDSGRSDQTSIVISGKVTGLDYSEKRLNYSEENNWLYDYGSGNYMSKVSFRDLKEYEMVDGRLFPGDKEGWEFSGSGYKAPSSLGYTVFEEEDHILEISDYIWGRIILTSGDDIIISPKKADEVYVVIGNDGADIFKLKRKGKGYMNIYDFKPEDGDKIDVAGQAEKYKVISAYDIRNEHGVDAQTYFGVDDAIMFTPAMDVGHFILHKKDDVFATINSSEGQILFPEEKKEWIDEIMSALI